MEDRISIEPAEDGDITIILRPRPRAEGDIEARIVRDAIDYLAELLISKGDGGKGEVLLRITEQEDMEDPITHNGIRPEAVPTPYYGATVAERLAIQPLEMLRVDEQPIATRPTTAARPRRR